MANEMITMVVPVYNMGKYLKRAVDALLKQTYRNFEILLVDDGSTDGSGAICDEYEKNNKSIRTIHKPNAGLSSARNVGIDNAKGEYIIFPDPDDWTREEYLQTLINLHTKYCSDLEICGHYVVEGDTEKTHNPQGKEQLLERDEAIEILMSSWGFCGFAWAKLYHMDIIRGNKLYFDLELGMAQDLHFSFRYFLCCQKIAYNPVPMYYYYQHAGGVTNTKSPLTQRKISGLKTYERIAELSKDKYPKARDLAYCTIANMSLQFIYIYYASKMNDEQLLKTLCNNLKTYKDYFLRNTDYSVIHRLQGRIALISPRIFYLIKGMFNKA